MLTIDFNACVYGHGHTIFKEPGIDFLYLISGNNFSAVSPLRGETDEDLGFQFRQCVPYYWEFAQNPAAFLSGHGCACLADKSSGRYALLAEAPEARVVWLFLNPGGQALMTCLSKGESEEERRKWNVVDGKALAAFNRFFGKHKNNYGLLRLGTAKRHKALFKAPGQERPGRHLAFFLDFDAHTFIDTDPSGPRGNFTREASGRFISMLPEALNKEAALQFGDCFSVWLRFVKNATRFLDAMKPHCLFDQRSGQYALLAQKEKTGFIWLILMPDGQTLAARLDTAQTEKEAEKWTFITEKPKNFDKQEGGVKTVSTAAVRALSNFLVRNQKQYSSLYKNAQTGYKDLINVVDKSQTTMLSAREGIERLRQAGNRQ
jgi:hypothetical protein